MRKRKILLFCLIGIFTIAAAILILLARSSPQITIEQLRAKIDSAIAHGSSPSHVLAFLDGNSISHSGYFEAKEYSLDKGDYNKLRMIYASMQRVERHLLTTHSVYIRFYFDGENRLVDYKVQKVRDK